MLMKKAWHWLLDLGVAAQPAEKVNTLRLYNAMAFISLMGAYGLSLSSLLLGDRLAYPIICFIAGTFYLVILVLNYFHRVNLSRYVLSICTLLIVCSTNFLIGGSIGGGIGILASMTIAYFLFREQKTTQQILLTLHILAFILSNLYVTTYGGLLGTIGVANDDIIVFICSIGWIIILLLDFEHTNEELIERLETKNEKLQATTDELKRFTYIASHDLRSPLRTILSFITLTERNIQRSRYDSALENISFIKSGAHQLNFLVQDILEFSKLRQTKEKERNWLDLNLIVEKVLQNLREDIQEKRAEIVCSELHRFYGNEVELLLLFQNFIQNGIKYNESARPTVYICSEQTHNGIRLVFRDNGIGIEEAYHNQIFQLFERLHNSEKYQGTGLGLGLCKKIIDDYGGKITVKSRSEQGTTFTIFFPEQETKTQER